MEHNTVGLASGLAYWIGQWSSQREVSEHRKRADESRIQRYILPSKYGLAKASVSHLSRTKVLKWVETLEEEGLGSATIYACLMIVRQAVALAESQGMTVCQTPHPTQSIKVGGISTIRQPDSKEILSEAEVQALVEATDPAYQALVLFCARTGARWEEVIGLRVQDLFLDQGLAVLGNVRIREERGAAVEVPGDHTRAVRLEPDVVQALKDYLDATQHYRRGHSGFVFLTKQAHRHPLRVNFSLHTWRPAVAAALGRSGLTFHCLRHTAAARFIRQGHSVEDVQKMLGHANDVTTKAMYKWIFAEQAAA